MTNLVLLFTQQPLTIGLRVGGEIDKKTRHKCIPLAKQNTHLLHGATRDASCLPSVVVEFQLLSSKFSVRVGILKVLTLFFVLLSMVQIASVTVINDTDDDSTLDASSLRVEAGCKLCFSL